MAGPMLPFNIDLLILSANDVKDLRPVKVLDIFDGFSKNFHPDGLFSTETFGKMGEERRNRMLTYINMHVSVFHPVIFKSLCDLKGLYGEIMSGRSYATFDPTIGDFEKSDAITGETGYAFFIKNFPQLKFEERPSAKREFNIKLLTKYRENCLMDKLVVMPAGLRDYTIDDNGKPSEDEINVLYRKVISVASVIENVNAKANAEYLDSARFNLQVSVMAIYDYIKSLLEGKSKLILGKWAGRKVFNSTRNVITSYIPDATELHSPKTVSSNQTVMGLYQYLRSILPLAVKAVRDTYLSDVFIGPNTPAVLVNKKTFKKELVQLDPEHYDEWMTYEGLEKVMARFSEENLRNEPLQVGNYYFGLIYKPKGFYKFIQDKDDLPEGADPADLYPITYAELLYLSVYKESHETPCFITRYPITGYGSIYPSYIYLKSTVKSEIRQELGDDWQPTGFTAYEFPVSTEQYYNSMSPGVTHISRLTADFDGDVCSGTSVMTEEAKQEVKKLLRSRDYYVGIDGNMTFSASNDIIDLVLVSITGD